ncbi:hypothetical protein [Nostoc sp.]|uniref:hypothetical protein n=1 Tax=Nostoc sp. TaxID=1180 RepID=UPI002FF7C660
MVDIDDLKRNRAQLIEVRDYAKAMVETVGSPMLVLNLDLQVMVANLSFYETFQVLPAQTEQHLIFELGNGEWNITKLRSLLEEILTSNTQFQNFEIEHDFRQIGHKIMLINAGKMPVLSNTQMILLAIKNITPN